MERIGHAYGFRIEECMEIAVAACEGAPVTIERGATVKLAEALEEIIDAGFFYQSALEIDMHRNTPDGSPPKDGYELVEQANKALLAYYGGTEHGENS